MRCRVFQRRSRCAIAAVLIAGCLAAPAAHAADITVTIEGVQSARGKVILELDGSPQAWDDKAPSLAQGSVKAEVGSVVYVFHEVQPGTVAIVVFHDENANGKFDSNFLGIPSEAWGFSRNFRGMRKAHFDEASVVVGEEPVALTIHLQRFGQK